MIPTLILQTWLCGLLSLGILSGAIYFAHEWQQRSWVWDASLGASVFQPEVGMNEVTGLLAAACVLVLITLFGGSLLKLVLSSSKPGQGANAVPPYDSITPRISQQIQRPDGTSLRVEVYGPENGMPIVLTHGWGLDSTEWTYFKREMADRFRLIVWDLPGLGKSTRPNNRDFSLDKMAHDLEAVLEFAGSKKAILVGHSIGGMIVMTFCRHFPAALGTRVQGLVLTHTTPTNPVRTTSGAAFLTAIQTPVLKPLMWLTIALSPVVWVMNWLSYRNGSMHITTKRGSFAGTESWAQIDFAARFQLRASPGVVARGMLGMMEYDATDVLPQINVPTLVIAGSDDTTTLPRASQAIQHAVPNGHLTTLIPAKHLGLVEHHEEYAEKVREFSFSSQNQEVPETAPLPLNVIHPFPQTGAKL
ncbi:pimeloyl-ACP methyl ester carboxylesterase [Prosthecobacter fusiformis]|uniref:Pimeloyl-ACP methyl ester carboxylesterase n=1 Tax=Prosthecobacter fusiformis TaxID=48464 RepID=A0A4R7RJY6_9BACT|nr:alpha/beta hydrolase [Prosthecobacter fusiformis]TDU62487.1 pimeloyl-ACP methyl ester carboxylesterase [Prosthecobacter fusiformis]